MANKNLRHIEVDGCIVNIRTGLRDWDGHAVTSVEIICDQYAEVGGKWFIQSDTDDTQGTYVNVRVRQEEKI